MFRTFVSALLAASFLVPNHWSGPVAATHSPNPIPQNFTYSNLRVQSTWDQFDSRVVDPKDLDCLAKMIYHEARGDSYIGQIAVAMVTINRTKSGFFPDTICKVIHQKGQYQWVRKNPPIHDKKSWEAAKTLAMYVILDYNQIVDPTHGALFFGKGKTGGVLPNKIGNHNFERKNGTPIYNLN